MIFDWTVNIGNLALQSVIYFGTALWFILSMKSDIRVLRHDFRALEDKQVVLNEAFTQLGKILTQVAVQDTRLNMIEKTVDELRHGKGYISAA